MSLRLAALALLLCVPAATADNWPQFRGPNGDGLSDAKQLPTKWSESDNIRWKTAIHDKGWSSPVVWKDQVWVTTAHEDGEKFYAVCLDRKSGKVVHDLHLFTESPPPKPNIKQYNSYASPTPAIEEGRIYAHFGTHGTACLDTATGKVIWERRDLKCDHFRGPASSPVIHKDNLILLFDGFDVQYVVCLNKRNGETVWRKDRTLPYSDTGRPMIDGDFKKAFATASVFVVNGKAQVVAPAAMGTIAYDLETGDEVWRVITGGMNESCRPILSNGLIYLNTGHTGNLLAVKAGHTGDLTKDGIAWRVDKLSATRPSPIVVGDLLFLVSDTGIPYCFDARTGRKHWQERFDGKFSASPVAAGETVYFPGENGKTYVVAASKEYKLVEVNVLESGCMASPAVAGNELFLRTKTHLYCIAKK